ncbi:MAG: hypothetical protein ACPGRW_06130 [Flavobacteriaceae bacterium]
MYSKITITFNVDLALNQTFGWESYSNTPVINNDIAFRIVPNRYGTGQISIGTPTATAGERTAINFIAAFNADWNINGNYTVSRNVNVVEIQSNISSIYYRNEFSYDVYGEQPPTPNNDVTFSDDPYNGTSFIITDLSFIEADAPCSHYKVSITTSVLAETITFTDGLVISNNTDNPFTFERLRGQGFKFTAESGDGQFIRKSVISSSAPQPNTSNNITVNITATPGGSTATINVNSTNTNEYSLDNSTWQDSNTFGSLTSGNYTAYVRDEWGCVATKDFSISETGILKTPYFLISKANSIRFTNRVSWDDCANYKILENTLSCEADVDLAYKEIQQFQSCDIITTQFKSNYDTITAHVIQEDGTETPLTINQMSNNIGLKDKRDAIKVEIDNKTGIYFTTGNLYDYDTGTDTGNDYILNGLLPSWAVVGAFFSIGNNWHQIESIIYNELRAADIIIYNDNYTGVDTDVQVACIYDVFNYEVYEFSIDMVAYLDETIQVRINNNDTNFDNLTHLSEVINVKIRHKNTIEVLYYNDENTDIFYATGIKNKIRLPITRKDAKPVFEIENHTTDTNTILLESEKRQAKEFEFEPVTEGIMEKLTQALVHRFLFLDGVRYVAESEPSIEGALEDTNLYIVKAKLIQAGSIYSSETGDASNQFASGDIEIPGLVDHGDGYVAY